MTVPRLTTRPPDPIPRDMGAVVAFALFALYGFILGAAGMALVWWLW